MKFSKKGTALCAFVVGAAVFTTTALADVIIGSGYNQLKESTKATFAKLIKDTDNFTSHANFSMKADGNVIQQATATQKYDMANKKIETESLESDTAGKTSSYYNYSDKDKYISRYIDPDSSEEVYHVTQKDETDNEPILENPFEEDMVKDAENVVDAFVGNLKDIVQVAEADGKKMYTANLTESQVPATVNALSSFALKYSLMDGRNEQGIPNLASDIYVKDAGAKVIENQNGLIESAVGSINFVGKDKNGTERSFSLEISIDITDVGATTVAEPDLTGKKVEYNTAGGSSFDEKYIGTYKSDIVTKEDNRFVKIGERVLNITSVTDQGLAGNYSENYVEGRAPAQTMAFEFTGNADKRYDCKFVYTDEDGNQKNGVIYSTGRNSQNLHVEIDVTFRENGYQSNSDFNGEFIRVFD